MKNNIEISDIFDEIQNLTKLIKTLDEKVDSLINKKKEQLQKKNAKRLKISPITEQDIESHKKKFNYLYKIWLNGDELKVINELENLSLDELRRFADANNLNVTSKTPKVKILQLISIRFKEKKMLSSNSNITKPVKDKD